MTDYRDPSPSDLQDWDDRPRIRERCECGGDMPGRCPGPRNCPMCQPDEGDGEEAVRLINVMEAV